MSRNKYESFTPTLFSDIFSDARFLGKNWLEKEFGLPLPAVNIHETQKEFNLEFAAPGFRKADFKISIDGNVLTIGAEKEEEKGNDTRKFTRREFSYNSFSRSFTLPGNVNSEQIDAKYTDGILKVSVPKIVDGRTASKKEIKVA